MYLVITNIELASGGGNNLVCDASKLKYHIALAFDIRNDNDKLIRLCPYCKDNNPN